MIELLKSISVRVDSELSVILEPGIQGEYESHVRAQYPNRSSLWREVESTGVKHDNGKPALDLIDPFFLEEVGQVLTYGATKYAPGNWRRGMAIGKAMAGVLRHCLAILRGEYLDPETKLPHAAHATCGLMFVSFYIRNKIDVKDDRWAK